MYLWINNSFMRLSHKNKLYPLDNSMAVRVGLTPRRLDGKVLVGSVCG